MVRRRIRKIQFRDIPGRRTRQMPRSGRVWLYEEPEGEDIHPPEPAGVDVRTEPHVDRRLTRPQRRKRIDRSVDPVIAENGSRYSRSTIIRRRTPGIRYDLQGREFSVLRVPSYPVSAQ